MTACTPQASDDDKLITDFLDELLLLKDKEVAPRTEADLLEEVRLLDEDKANQIQLRPMLSKLKKLIKSFNAECNESDRRKAREEKTKLYSSLPEKEIAIRKKVRAFNVGKVNFRFNEKCRLGFLTEKATETKKGRRHDYLWKQSRKDKITHHRSNARNLASLCEMTYIGPA